MTTDLIDVIIENIEISALVKLIYFNQDFKVAMRG